VPNPPHTVSQPCSTLHGDASQRPVTDSAGTMLIDVASSAPAPAESVAFTENEKAPDAFGVPETELPDTASGGGRAPTLIDQEYGGVPPEAVNGMAG
jgi:hypothetical protein